MCPWRPSSENTRDCCLGLAPDGAIVAPFMSSVVVQSSQTSPAQPSMNSRPMLSSPGRIEREAQLRTAHTQELQDKHEPRPDGTPAGHHNFAKALAAPPTGAALKQPADRQGGTHGTGKQERHNQTST